MTTVEPVLRYAARAVVLDPEDRVLLVRFEGEGSAWWATPGGGLEPGETHEVALARELREETGFVADVGPCLWTREHVFPWKERVLRQRERYYLVRVASLAPEPEMSAEMLEAEGIFSMRWWDVADIPDHAELFAPRRLGQLLRELLARGAPAEPFEIGA